jgi:hypothetical protein
MATFHDIWPDWEVGVKRMPVWKLVENSMGWKVKNTLEANFVALQTVHSLDKEGLACRGHSREVILLPLNGSINVFEDFLHRICDFCTDTISWDEGNLSDNM